MYEIIAIGMTLPIASPAACRLGAAGAGKADDRIEHFAISKKLVFGLH